MKRSLFDNAKCGFYVGWSFEACYQVNEPKAFLLQNFTINDTDDLEEKIRRNGFFSFLKYQCDFLVHSDSTYLCSIILERYMCVYTIHKSISHDVFD